MWIEAIHGWLRFPVAMLQRVEFCRNEFERIIRILELVAQDIKDPIAPSRIGGNHGVVCVDNFGKRAILINDETHQFERFSPQCFAILIGQLVACLLSLLFWKLIEVMLLIPMTSMFKVIVRKDIFTIAVIPSRQEDIVEPFLKTIVKCFLSHQLCENGIEGVYPLRIDRLKLADRRQPGCQRKGNSTKQLPFRDHFCILEKRS